MNPYKDLEETSFIAASHLTYEDIATKLLKDHYFLTALELHTELVESGRELPQLREFFSNPGNFEQHVSRATDFSSMHRTPSQATLDSLDAARYSEDGGGDRGGSGGDVAVLEFELRKARETINSLRANLTQFADGDSPLDNSTKESSNERSLKPHEKRALNFLINEYLLLQDYKLTSITFSDENPDQDFEDWDDVRLNVPRPSGLVSMFWGNKTVLKVYTCEATTQVDWDTVENGCQTDIDESIICTNYQPTLEHDPDWNHELLIQTEEIELLKQKVIALETEKLNFQKLYDAAIVSLNALTSPGSENKNLDIRIPEDKLHQTESEYSGAICESKPLTLTATDNYYGSNTHSTHSATPEQFELIDNEKTTLVKKEGSNTSSFEPAILGGGSNRDSPLRRGSVTTLDESLSINDGGEWTRVQYDYTMENASKDILWIESGLPNTLKLSLLNWCCETLSINVPVANDLLSELVNADKPVNLQTLLTIVADTIPRVIPHMLVGRRCEMVALLVATIHLLSLTQLSDATRRARLLHLLLTLKKTPDAAETRIISEAACLIVKWGGSGEMLSCIAELLTSRTAERRVLASQICLSIAPYVSIELCTSLLFSLVVLMCESSEIEIRCLGLKAVCLICPVAEHKYGHLENILFSFLRDSSDGIVKDTVSMFVPVLARTALIAGKFSTDLLNRIISNLVKASNDKEWKCAVLYLSVMKMLVLAKLAYIVNVEIVKDVTRTNCDSELMNYQDVSLVCDQEDILDIQCFMTDTNLDGKALLMALNSLIKEKPDVRWPEINWFINLVKHILDIAVSCKCLNQASVYEQYISLINCYVESCGHHITLHVLKPIFMDIIMDLEYKMERLHTVANESAIVVGIYSVAVLPALENNEEFKAFFHKWIVYSSIRNLPVKIFSVPLRWIGRHKSNSLQLYLKLLQEFVRSSSESSSGVAIRVYLCNLITELLNITDISECCVETHLLPTIITLMHDNDVSVRECAISAWGSVARVCVTREFPCEVRCWSAIDSILGGEGNDLTSITAREAARAAEALAILVMPTTETIQMTVCNKAVSLVCSLCLRAPLSPESLSALTPGLQLVAHHARAHPALLPALRKLEEGVQSANLSQYKPAIEALIYNIAGPANTSPVSVGESQPRPTTNLQAAQEVGRRVTQMFQQSKTNMNLQNIFKKKT